jgi:hypothetical protein
MVNVLGGDDPDLYLRLVNVMDDEPPSVVHDVCAPVTA